MSIVIQKLREATGSRRDDRRSQNGGFERNEDRVLVSLQHVGRQLAPLAALRPGAGGLA